MMCLSLICFVYLFSTKLQLDGYEKNPTIKNLFYTTNNDKKLYTKLQLSKYNTLIRIIIGQLWNQYLIVIVNRYTVYLLTYQHRTYCNKYKN